MGLISSILIIVLLSIISISTRSTSSVHHNNRKLPSCFPSLDSISNVAIDFELQNGYVYHPGHFNHASSLDTFKQNACPVETVLHSCHLGNPSKAVQLESQRYVLSNNGPGLKCNFEQFIPGVFLDRIRHRHVLFVGDSLNLQLWQMLICSLHGSTEASYDIEWLYYHDRLNVSDADRKLYRNCPFGAQHCYILSGKVFYPHFNTTISVQSAEQLRREPLLHFIDKFQLQKQDVFVYNFGLHFNDMKEYKELLQDFAKDFVQTKQALGVQHMPLLLWRETTPQHFSKGGPAGYFVNLDSCGYNYSKDSYYKYDHRNRLADEILEPLMPIVRIVNSTFMDVSSHIDIAMLAPPLFDCSHYCLPSNPLYIFRDIFFNVFHVLKNNSMSHLHHRDHFLRRL